MGEAAAAENSQFALPRAADEDGLLPRQARGSAEAAGGAEERRAEREQADIRQLPAVASEEGPRCVRLTPRRIAPIARQLPVVSYFSGSKLICNCVFRFAFLPLRHILFSCFPLGLRLAYVFFVGIKFQLSRHEVSPRIFMSFSSQVHRDALFETFFSNSW